MQFSCFSTYYSSRIAGSGYLLCRGNRQHWCRQPPLAGIEQLGRKQAQLAVASSQIECLPSAKAGLHQATSSFLEEKQQAAKPHPQALIADFRFLYAVERLWLGGLSVIQPRQSSVASILFGSVSGLILSLLVSPECTAASSTLQPFRYTQATLADVTGASMAPLELPADGVLGSDQVAEISSLLASALDSALTTAQSNGFKVAVPTNEVMFSLYGGVFSSAYASLSSFWAGIQLPQGSTTQTMVFYVALVGLLVALVNQPRE